jgi:hypothetical protein
MSKKYSLTFTFVSGSVLCAALLWRNWQLYKERESFQSRSREQLGKIQAQLDEKQRWLEECNRRNWEHILLDGLVGALEEAEQAGELKTKESYEQFLKHWIETSL